MEGKGKRGKGKSGGNKLYQVKLISTGMPIITMGRARD
jgi:hypothetical protein